MQQCFLLYCLNGWVSGSCKDNGVKISQYRALFAQCTISTLRTYFNVYELMALFNVVFSSKRNSCSNFNLTNHLHILYYYFFMKMLKSY